jgi:hypothetical protein
VTFLTSIVAQKNTKAISEVVDKVGRCGEYEADCDGLAVGAVDVSVRLQVREPIFHLPTTSKQTPER